MLKALRHLALWAFLIASLAAPALAQNNFPTTGGATVPGFVTMCIVANVATPCAAGGALTIGTTTITGGADTQVLFNSAGVVSSDAGLTKVAGATGKVTAGGLIGSSSAGTAAAPSVYVGNATTGLFSVSTTGLGLSSNGVNVLDFGITSGGQLTVGNNVGLFLQGGANVQVPNNQKYAWSNGSSILSSGSGVFQFQNNGNTQNFTVNTASSGGPLMTAAVGSNGTVPTGNTGTCSTAITVAGGATAGTWTSTAICALGGTIILTAMPAAPTGYACFMTDRTTNGVTINQSATTTTSATFIVRSLPTGSVATAANDILQYHCMGY